MPTPRFLGPVARGFARAGVSRGGNLPAIHRDYARSMRSREVCGSVCRCVVGYNDLVRFTDFSRSSVQRFERSSDQLLFVVGWNDE